MFNPLPASGEREGPAAKPWEGEGQERHETHQGWAAYGSRIASNE
jgi:hypothetical protein